VKQGHRRGSTLWAAVALVAVASLATGCTRDDDGDTMTSQDAAGMTREQVSQSTLEDEFGLVSDRYTHLQGLLEGAQRQVDDGPWRWNGGDVLPIGGGSGGVGEPPVGADDSNSYYLSAGRIIHPEGATGAESDLEPMTDYFDEQGWTSSVEDVSDTHYLLGDTGDGWQVEYAVSGNGQYSLTVYSELFWTNDYGALLKAVSSRLPADRPEESSPGEYVAFPRWDDPPLR